MTISKGGRGKTAPYDTTHVRVPEPVKNIVEKVIQRYKERLESGMVDPGEKEFEPSYLTPDVFMYSLQDATRVAQEVLKSKKSAKQSMEKLLTTIYQEEVKL